MSYTYKNGYREGVVFIFLEDERVLIENRSVDDNTYEVFFTSGSIEEKDYLGDSDYKINAMLREVDEEFNHKVKIRKYEYLEELKVEEINVIFYIYLITDWEGKIPNFTIENSKKDADLQWINLDEKEQYLIYDSAFEICRRIETHISLNKEKQ